MSTPTRLDEVERKVAALEMFARPRDHEARIAWLEDVTRTVNEALGRAPASIHPPYMSALDAAEIYDSHVNKRTAGEPPAPSEPSGIPDFLKRLGLPHDERAVKVFLHGDWARDPDPLEPNYYMEDAALRAELEATRKERDADEREASLVIREGARTEERLRKGLDEARTVADVEKRRGDRRESEWNAACDLYSKERDKTAALEKELEATKKERAKPKDCNCRALVEHWMGHWRDSAHRAERDRDAAREERDRLVEEIEPLRETVSRGILGHDFAEIEGGTADLRAKLAALVEAAEALPWGSGSDRRAVRVGRGLVIAPEWGTLRDATDEAKR